MTQIRIPGYTLKRKLGQGGMAAVFLAEQESFGREVALKIMSPAMAKEPGFAERFLREARTMAALSHPNIIVVHDVGQAGSLYYYAMAALTGGDLTQRIRGGGLSPAEALRITRQVADALACAHDQGIVHRDIKPDNVLFREVDDAAILTDFGIAKLLNDRQNQLTQAGSTVGTPRYMSPEQARGQALDGRSDLYSLGVMFYEMLTGEPPFRAEEAVTLAIKHCQEPVPRLRSDLARFQPTIDRLLAKEPRQRPADGRELIALLDDLLEGRRPAPSVTRPALQGAATLIMPAVQPAAPTEVRPTPNARPASEPFFRLEEETSGGFFSKRHALRAAFSADDYEEFKRQLQTLQDHVREWQEKRGRKAVRLDISVQAHPWIHGRVREAMARARHENTPLGALLNRAEVTLHICAEDDPEGQRWALSTSEGKAVEAKAPAP